MSKLSPEAASTYVAFCLRLNPLWEAEAVMIARADAHGVTDSEKSSLRKAADEAERKTALRDSLYQLRDNIWKAPIDQLQDQLATLPLEGQPELQILAARLRTITNARSSLPALTQDKHFDGDFFACFKQVLSGGPRESAAVREKVAASFQGKTLGRRGRRMITLLKREVPELFNLEQEWLTGLTKKRFGSVTVDTGGLMSESSHWHLGVCLIIFVVVPVLVFLIDTALEYAGQ